MTAIAPRSPVLALYRGATSIAAPLARLLLRRRADRGKEDPQRLHERFGIAHMARPDGALVWAHAASVGESVSILPLIRAVQELRRDAHVLVTTGTVTSAKLMAERLPPRAFHQFAPVDLAAAVAGFLDHWRPDLAIWVESELWPNLILETAARDIPMALISARMSEASQRTWARAPAAAHAVLNSFKVLMPQDAAAAQRLKALGAARIGEPSNLKLWAEPLPFNVDALTKLLNAIGGRPVWLAASTHEGEEVLAARMHRSLVAQIPNLLTMIAPRHPLRGPDIMAALAQEGVATAQRSHGDLPGANTAIYLADTMGEMGVLYRASPVVFIGKTLIGQGGQNPLEPARLACAIVCGPNISNFEPIFDMLLKARACEVLANEGQVLAALAQLLTQPEEARSMGMRAERVAGDPLPLERTLAELRPLITAMPHDARA